MAGKKRSYASRKHADDTPEGRWIALLGGHFVWLQMLANGGRTIGSVKILGLSVRFDYMSVLVIARGFHLVNVENVVAFGSGVTLYRAFVNLTHALQKNQWQPDKFHPFIPASPPVG